MDGVGKIVILVMGICVVRFEFILYYCGFLVVRMVILWFVRVCRFLKMEVNGDG